MKHTASICVALFCIECGATAGSLVVHVKDAPSGPGVITLLVDDGSSAKPLIFTRQLLSSEPPILQQVDLAREAVYRIRAAVLSPDRQTSRISAVAAVQNVLVRSDSSSIVDLSLTPVTLSVQHASSGGNDRYSASLDDPTGFFTDLTATGVLSITSRRLGNISVKRDFSRLSRPPAGTTRSASFTVPSPLEESTYDLMLYFPDLSDSGRMAIIGPSSSEAASSRGDTPLPVDERRTPLPVPGLGTRRSTDATSDQPGRWVVRVGADGRLVRVEQK